MTRSPTTKVPFQFGKLKIELPKSNSEKSEASLFTENAKFCHRLKKFKSVSDYFFPWIFCKEFEVDTKVESI